MTKPNHCWITFSEHANIDGLLLKMILEKTQAATARSLFVCSVLLLLFANGAHGGTYQRTDDRKARVWNDHPGRGEKASWSGDLDSDRYATGPGTLTWFKVEPPVVTGSNIPASRRERVVVLSRYSGNMVRGKLDGPVENVDSKGTTFHALFANGSRVDDWAPGPAPTPTPDRRRHGRAEEAPVVTESVHEPRPTPNQRRDEQGQEGSVAAASTQEPKPTPDQQRDQPAQERSVTESSAKGPKLTPDQRRDQTRDAVVEAPTQGTASLELGRPPSSLRMSVVAAASPQASVPSTPSSSSSSAAGADPAIKNRIIADFKDETQSVLSRVGDATGNFHEIDRLDSVQKLPVPVSERVGSLAERARDFRSKLGYEAGALQECRTETETVDALSVVDQITRSIAAKDTSQANSRLANFLKNNPNPTADSQKALWRYLTSMRSLCNRLEKEADTHLQQAQSLSAAGKTSDAIREYKEAYRTFPKPATAEKIRQLQNSSPGL
jgi:hypothetical protein